MMVEQLNLITATGAVAQPVGGEKTPAAILMRTDWCWDLGCRLYREAPRKAKSIREFKQSTGLRPTYMKRVGLSITANVVTEKHGLLLPCFLLTCTRRKALAPAFAHDPLQNSNGRPMKATT